jgi:hypothetical protein
VDPALPAEEAPCGSIQGFSSVVEAAVLRLNVRSCDDHVERAVGSAGRVRVFVAMTTTIREKAKASRVS